MLIFKDKTGSMPEEMFSYVESNWIVKAIAYIIDSRLRKAVTLVPWLSEQVDNPSPELIEAVNIATKGIDKSDYDARALACLKYVAKNIKYVGDMEQYKMQENWAIANDVLRTKQDDCDGGGTLLYVMCRLAGIPANRLLCLCGDVVGGGHFWVAYKPQQYPLNWVFLDWCYWYNQNSIDGRPKFYIQDQTIYGEDNRYKKIWFAFNDKKSYFGLRNPYA